MAFKRTRRGRAIKRRTLKRGFGIKRTNQNKRIARIAQAVVRKNCETKYTRTYHSHFLRNIAKLVTTATRDLPSGYIKRLADYPSVYTGSADEESLHQRIGNRIENVRTYNNIIISYKNYMASQYLWNWYHCMVRVIVFSPLDSNYDGTTSADNFFITALDPNMSTTIDAVNPMTVPINRTLYRVYYDKVYKKSTTHASINGAITENSETTVGTTEININMKAIKSVLFSQTGPTTTAEPKYPKYNRFLAIIPYSDDDSSTTGPLIRYQTIANMYFTDS